MSDLASLLKAVHGPIQAWAASNKGKAHIAASHYHAFYILQQNPGGFVAVVLAKSADKHGDFEEAGWEKVEFGVILSQEKGMQLEAGARLTEPLLGGKAMFTLIDECIGVVRGLDLEVKDPGVDFQGWDSFKVQDWATDAYELRFRVIRQLPEPV